MLDEIVSALACPSCGEALVQAAGALACGNGHVFDVARQGYVNLLPGGAKAGSADTEAMVRARATFLGSGHFAPMERAIAHLTSGLLADGPEGCVVDVGAGTGHYLARVLDQAPGRSGLALDISKFAARRAAKAHPRIGAIVCDAWGRLPVRTGAAALVLDVFAPRNGEEFSRVLAPGGSLVVVTPTERHLLELIGPLGLLTVDLHKAERLAESMSEHFVRVDAVDLEVPMMLRHPDVAAVVAMGPSARHTDPATLSADVSAMPELMQVTLSVLVSVFRRAN